MSNRLLKLRRDDSCSVCSAETPAGKSAWWDNIAKTVTCKPCNDSAVQHPDTPGPLQGRAPGQSAQAEYERRQARHHAKVAATYGTGMIGTVAKTFTSEPQTTTAWAKGATGERGLAKHLATKLTDDAVLVHDLLVPGSKANIDHLVIASSGVWVVDAKNYSGKVEFRAVGSWRRPEPKLFAGGRDRTKLVDAMEWQTALVKERFKEAGVWDVSVHAALCFVASDWPLLAKPFQIRGVWVCWPQSLVKLVKQPGSLENPQSVAQILTGT